MKNLPKKVRSKKLSSRVDLTAMVSVSFLLIIFFMVVGELSKQKIMFNEVPSCIDEHPFIDCYMPDENRTVTILLGDDNKLVTYSGLLFVPIQEPRQVKYGKNGIRKELLDRNKKVLEYSANKGKPGMGINVIIKPSGKCNFKNLVDILDEMEITQISSYSIVNQFTPEETNLLAVK